MSQAMARLCICFLLVILAFTFAEGAKGNNQKPKKMKCHEKKAYPECFKRKDLYCPQECPRHCYVDCANCLTLCKSPSPPISNYSPPPQSTPRSSPPPARSTPPSWSPPPTSTSPTTPPTLPSPPATSSPPSWNPPPTSTPTPPSGPSSSTPPSPPVSTLPLPSSAPKRVKCNNRNYAHCYGMEHSCPSACPDSCDVDCVTCGPVCNCNRPGSVCQDPRFIGGDGITFYFHGKKDRDFCILSDSNLHINAHFIGRRKENMKRDFTWVQSLGILFDSHRLFIGAKKTAMWDDSNDRLSLAFDGETIHLPEGEGANWQQPAQTSPIISITRSRDTNAVEIEVENNFKIKALVVPITETDSRIHNYGITADDCFAHLDLSFKFYALSGGVNGVLGQTYASNYVSKNKMGVVMPVLGGDKEFASSSLFATDCAVARFNDRQLPSLENLEYAKLDCASGMGDRGVVCKR